MTPCFNNALVLTSFHRAARLSLERRVGVAACFLLLLLAIQGGAQAPQTPIKVHGGSMTFFSAAIWNQERTAAGPGYCAEISRADLANLRFDDFYPESESFARQPRPSKRVLNTTEWRLELRGHEEDEVTAFRASPDGLALQASFRACDGRPGASIHLSPLGKAGFYPTDLVAAGMYKSNKRFASQCKVDRDRCERMAHIRLFDAKSTTPGVQLACPDGACTVYVGRTPHTITLPRARSAPR